MSELEEKLENILGNPQAMAQIMSLAQSLGGGGGGGQAHDQGGDQSGQAPSESAPPDAPPPSPDEETEASVPSSSSGGMPDLFSALGGLDIGTLSAAANLIGQFSREEDDRRTALLRALRPFVRESRYAKLDKAIQIAKLSRLIRSGLELFRTKEEDSHV